MAHITVKIDENQIIEALDCLTNRELKDLLASYDFISKDEIAEYSIKEWKKFKPAGTLTDLQKAEFLQENWDKIPLEKLENII